MELSAIQAILSSSSNEDWHVVATGPTFRLHTYQAIEEHASGGSTSSGIEHDQTASYRSDVSLTIAWGLLPSGAHIGPQPWAQFPDDSVTPFNLDTFWMGALVDRSTFCLVDGYRAVLPWPKFEHISGDGELPGVVVPPTTTPAVVAVARLIDGLSGNREFDSYLGRSGIIISE